MGIENTFLHTLNSFFLLKIYMIVIIVLIQNPTKDNIINNRTLFLFTEELHEIL